MVLISPQEFVGGLVRTPNMIFKVNPDLADIADIYRMIWLSCPLPGIARSLCSTTMPGQHLR